MPVKNVVGIQYATISTNSSVQTSIWIPPPSSNSTTVIGQGYWTQPSASQTAQGMSNVIANVLYFAQAQTQTELTTAVAEIMKNIIISDGDETKIVLPDGTEIDVQKDGSYAINDKKAQVIYRACRIRDFNTFLNASDKLEAFIKFCGEHGVKQDEMLELPIRLFVGWLILEAAKADQETVADVNLLPGIQKATRPRCRECNKFIKRAFKLKGIEFCGTECFEKALKNA